MRSVINSTDLFLVNSAGRRIRMGRRTRVWKVSRGSEEYEGEDS